MMTVMAEKFVSAIGNLELNVQPLAFNPTSITLHPNVKTGPYCIKKFWYDFHDDTPTFGVTYVETSVKTDKTIEIFKPIRCGAPSSVVGIWVDNLLPLLKALSKESNGKISQEFLTNASDEIREAFKEMLENE